MKARDVPTPSMQDVQHLGPDGFHRTTFTLPFEEARVKAREIIQEFPADGYMKIVEHWQQLPDGQIQFTMRRIATED